MLLDALNKIMYLIFWLSTLNTLRHVYYFIQAYISSTPEEPRRYTISNKSLFLLGASIAYLLTTLITGIKL